MMPPTPLAAFSFWLNSIFYGTKDTLVKNIYKKKRVMWKYLDDKSTNIISMNLELMNFTLFCKWIVILHNEEGVWQQLLINKYMQNKTLFQAEAQVGDSHFLYGLMKVKHLCMACCSFSVGDGCQVRFWEDVWNGDNNALKCQFPNLYNIDYNKKYYCSWGDWGEFWEGHFQKDLAWC